MVLTMSWVVFIVETVAHQRTVFHFNIGPLEVGDFHQIVMLMSKMSYFMDSNLGGRWFIITLKSLPSSWLLNLNVELLWVWVGKVF